MPEFGAKVLWMTAPIFEAGRSTTVVSGSTVGGGNFVFVALVVA